MSQYVTVDSGQGEQDEASDVPVSARGGGGGLDAEIQGKLVDKYNKNQDIEFMVQCWVEGVTGEFFEKSTFGRSLRDGVLLCQLANAIKPGIIPTINCSDIPYKQMENISMFLRACRILGVAEHSLFETIDLYEVKDLNLVIQCLYQLGVAIQTTVPTFEGPHLGGKSYASLYHPSSPKSGSPFNSAVGNLQISSSPETNRPPSRSKTNYSSTVPTVLPPPVNSAPPEQQCRIIPPIATDLTSPPHSPTSAARSACASPATGARGHDGNTYGLDLELSLKREAAYDKEAERQVLSWVGAVLGDDLSDMTLSEALRDGRRLCRLVNAIRPDSVPKISESKIPYKEMENCSNFLRACRTLGVAEHSLFETVDLYEEKDLGLVLRALHALGTTVQSTVPTFTGPHLGRKSAASSGSPEKSGSPRRSRLHSGGR